MNAVTKILIPKIYAVGTSQEPMTQAALIAAGLVSGDLSNSAVQDAITDVTRIATSSENPTVWLAALLADLATNGLP